MYSRIITVVHFFLFLLLPSFGDEELEESEVTVAEVK